MKLKKKKKKNLQSKMALKRKTKFNVKSHKTQINNTTENETQILDENHRGAQI